MVSAEQLLATLEEKGLLPPQVIGRLRKQIAQSGQPISAAALAKQLVEKGLLQPAQVESLLERGPAKPPALEKKTEPAGSESLDPSGGSSGLVDLFDEQLPPAAKAAGPGAVASPRGKPPQRTPHEPRAKSAGGVDAGTIKAPLEQLPPAGQRPFKTKANRRPVLYAALGLVAVILLIVGIFVVRLSYAHGQEELQQAEAAYQAGNLAEAVAIYDRFLENFPRGEGAGLARVHRGLCRLRLATGGSPDWPVAAALAMQIVAEIGPEPALNDARRQLGGLLSAIADGLAGGVRENPDSAAMTKTRQMLDLIARYVPRSQRNHPLIADVEVVLAIAQRRIDRPGELDKVIAAIRQAAAQGKPQEVYALRTALLKTYPELADHAGLREALLLAARAEMGAVKTVQRKQSADNAEATGPVVAALTLAARRHEADAPVSAGRVLVAVVHGAAFGIDAATGKPLWRRYVGLDGAARADLDPWIVADQPPGGLVLWDSARREVLRVDARSGRLRWRHPLGEEVAVRPMVAAGKVLAATRSGLLAIIDLASGDAVGAVRLPQPPCAAVVDANRLVAFLVGRQQQIYVLSLTDGHCRQVYSLEHSPGSISAPPVVWGGLLLVAVNDRLWESTLHVLSIGQDESAPLAPLQQIRLRGHVDVAPQCAQGRMALATDCGAVCLFEGSGGTAGKPLKKIAELPAAGPEGVVRFPIFDGNRLWVADTQLTACDVGTEGRLVAKTRGRPPGTFQQPLAVSGRVLFHARRRDDLPGLVVSAVDAAAGKTYWETTVGAPLAAGVAVDAQGGTLTAATTAGAVFHIATADIKDRWVSDQPLAAKRTLEPFGAPTAALLALDHGELALVGGAHGDIVSLLHSAGAGPSLQLPDLLTAPPIAFAGGLLAAGSAGQVLLCDVRHEGRVIGTPFQPLPAAPTRCCWTAPVAAGKDRFAIADGRKTLYLVGLKSGPQPQLIELARAAIPAPIVLPLAIAAGKTLYAVDAAGCPPDTSRRSRGLTPSRCSRR